MPEPRASACAHCGDRGWGVRAGFIRRCEVCCVFPNDAKAREAAKPDLTRFTLRERPEATVSSGGVMRCPWCNHLPTNKDIDTFWMLQDMEVVCKARVGKTYEAHDDDGWWLQLGEETHDTDTTADIRLWCPNPKCRKTFTPPEGLDFESNPIADE